MNDQEMRDYFKTASPKDVVKLLREGWDIIEGRATEIIEDSNKFKKAVVMGVEVVRDAREFANKFKKSKVVINLPVELSFAMDVDTDPESVLHDFSCDPDDSLSVTGKIVRSKLDPKYRAMIPVLNITLTNLLDDACSDLNGFFPELHKEAEKINKRVNTVARLLDEAQQETGMGHSVMNDASIEAIEEELKLKKPKALAKDT